MQVWDGIGVGGLAGRLNMGQWVGAEARWGLKPLGHRAWRAANRALLGLARGFELIVDLTKARASKASTLVSAGETWGSQAQHLGQYPSNIWILTDAVSLKLKWLVATIWIPQIQECL